MENKDIVSSSKCDGCIHKAVCNKMDAFSSTIEKIKASFLVSESSSLSEDFKITVECKHFKKIKQEIPRTGFYPNDDFH